MKQRLAIIIPALLLLGVLIFLFRSSGYCDSAHAKYGFKVPVCPNGTPRQLVSVWGRELIRGGEGEVEVVVNARYTTAKADEALSIALPKFKTQLFLVDAQGKQVALPITGKWASEGPGAKAKLKLPVVDDGDYLLRSVVTTKLGESIVDMKLPLYAPARIHLLTDRPLYEPGNLVQFRALALRARDFTPIDNRPGTWIVRDPSGEILLEEKAPAGEWGVVAGDFPLASDAAVGTWSVAWRSGADEQSASFLVQPFVLPRFRIDSQADKSFYQAGDAPTLTGAVVYSSGAPVADAELEIQWSASGAWPPPNDWLEGTALPRSARTAADGRFELKLPKVPADLRARCTLTASIAATDPAGDRVVGVSSLLLSEDALQVAAVTELEGGLVESNNNRVYLRVTDPTGNALGGAKINVKRAWAPGDQGIDAELDSDGVARIQFDPGRPISVVVPPMPVRESPRQSAGGATLSTLSDLVSSSRDASIADQVAVESWLTDMQPCARWVRAGSQSSTVSFRVSASGAISSVTPHTAEAGSGPPFRPGPLDRCLADLIGKRSMPRGRDRLYEASFWLQEAQLPTLTPTVSRTNSSDDLQRGRDAHLTEFFMRELHEAALDTRNCLPRNFEGELPFQLFWRITAGSKKVAFSWLKDTGSSRVMPMELDGCIMRSVLGIELRAEAMADEIGLVRYQLSQPAVSGQELAPQPTILQGYELTVEAQLGAEDLGSTRLIMQPGTVPDLRLRATPVVANAGDEIELAFFRGPNYQGDIPREIRMQHQGGGEELELKDKAKSATFKLPDEAKGWYEFSAQGARALVFVRSTEDLSLSLTPGQDAYQPGASASLQIQTQVAGVGAKAAVGLFGVDNSLSQIATLRGPDDLGSLRPAIIMHEQAFGALDAQALTLGRIRGAQAMEATVLRVDAIPAPGDTDRVLYESAETEFNPLLELTDHFYIALAELHEQTRAWEKNAAKGETMTPKQMAALWQASLKACKARGNAIVDSYGRPLRLHWLPEDLLSLTDPAQVVADATRLPEDVENWQQWVMKEKP